MINDVHRKFYTIRDLKINHNILFLVEKSLANINCLLACLSVRKGQKNIDFERYREVPIRVDRRVFDIEELEYKVRSLVSSMLLSKTRGLPGNHAFSMRVDRKVFTSRNSNLWSDHWYIVGFSMENRRFVLNHGFL